MLILLRMFLKLVNRTDMKKIICFLLVIIVANTILYAQIEGVIKWEENKDFTYQEIDKLFGDKIDYLFVKNVNSSNISSTIIDVSDNHLKIVRQGEIKIL